MNFLNKLLSGLLLVLLFSSCENEVEINDDFKEVTNVFGLLSVQEDTQFVKITRTFLDESQSAVQLASDPERLYYDSLNVSLLEEQTGNVFPLSKTIVPKEPGFFTQQDNEVYITTQQLSNDYTYRLKVLNPNGDSAIGRTNIIEPVNILKPDARRGAALFFIDIRDNFTEYQFEFSTGIGVGEFQVKMNFKYIEIINNDSTEKVITFPLATIINNNINTKGNFKIIFDGFRFFEAIEKQIPASINAPKRVLPQNNIEIIVDAADEDYALYRDVNGPIEGLAQIRPEYKNITNGIGLFSSRSTTIGNSRINDDTKNYLINVYGTGSTGEKDPNTFRGFTF